MSIVKADISMSLDGYVTGPNDGVGQGLGEGGEALHEWIVGLASWRERHGYEGGVGGTDADVMEEAFAGVGAIVMGRRMFDHGEGPWGDEPPFRMPVFVVTHQAREPLEKAGGTTFTFVSKGGPARALELAREAAGDGDVSIAGGADVIRQTLSAGLLDQLQVHVVPVLMGGGVRLFDGLGQEVRFEQTRAIASDAVTHLRLRVVRR